MKKHLFELSDINNINKPNLLSIVEFLYLKSWNRGKWESGTSVLLY